MTELIPVRRFFVRVFVFFSMISFYQLFHLTLVSEIEISNINTLICIYALGLILLLFPIFRLSEKKQNWPEINIKLFTVMFVITFFVTLFMSRFPYITSFIDVGMYKTRTEGELGQGGGYSFITIFFYPLCIVLAFLRTDHGRKYVFLSMMLLIIAIDLVILGTRGVPFFVLLFHFLMVNRRLFSIQSFAFFIILLTIFIFIFSYQTEERSLGQSLNWFNSVRYSWIFDNLPIKNYWLEIVPGRWSDAFSLVYIGQYVTHSIAEFTYMLNEGIFSLTGDFLYFKDELCLVLGCDRAPIQEAISTQYPRTGLYQTLYSSLLKDFGILGFLSIFIVTITFLSIYPVGVLYVISSVYIGVIVSVSGIENYIYTGLGLARGGIFVFLWFILSLHGFKVSLKK